MIEQSQLLTASLATLAIILGLLLTWLFPVKLVSRLAHRLGHSMPCPSSLSWTLDNSWRRRAMRPVLERIGIQPGETVLELGPGCGAYTPGAARRAGPEGRLIAVDIQPEMISRVQKRVRAEGLTNVETHVASAHSLPMEDDSVDRAFLITVLPEIPDPRRALAELHRVLRPGGLLSVTEEFLDPDYRFVRETIDLVGAAGFRFEERFGNVWIYTANFRKEAST